LNFGVASIRLERGIGATVFARLRSLIKLAANSRNSPEADVPADDVPSFILHGRAFWRAGRDSNRYAETIPLEE
jgi:hypothetical protein